MAFHCHHNEDIFIMGRGETFKECVNMLGGSLFSENVGIDLFVPISIPSHSIFYLNTLMPPRQIYSGNESPVFSI